jgi:hypothetical protein
MINMMKHQVVAGLSLYGLYRICSKSTIIRRLNDTKMLISANEGHSEDLNYISH